MSWFSGRKDYERRVVRIADGRILFLPRGGGRAYQVPDFETGWKMEDQLTWIERVGRWIVIPVSVWVVRQEDWRYWALLLVVVIGGTVGDRVVLRKARAATDPLARAEAARRAEKISLWTIGFAAALTAASVLAFWTQPPPRHWVAAALPAVFALLTIFLAVLASRQRSSPVDHADGSPIEPR